MLMLPKLVEDGVTQSLITIVSVIKLKAMT